MPEQMDEWWTQGSMLATPHVFRALQVDDEPTHEWTADGPAAREIS